MHLKYFMQYLLNAHSNRPSTNRLRQKCPQNQQAQRVLHGVVQFPDTIDGLGDKPALPVQALKVLLLDGLLTNESHSEPRHNFADRFCIIDVVLLGLYVWLDEPRRHHPHRITHSARLYQSQSRIFWKKLIERDPNMREVASLNKIAEDGRLPTVRNDISSGSDSRYRGC